VKAELTDVRRARHDRLFRVGSTHSPKLKAAVRRELLVRGCSRTHSGPPWPRLRRPQWPRSRSPRPTGERRLHLRYLTFMTPMAERPFRVDISLSRYSRAEMWHWNYASKICCGAARCGVRQDSCHASRKMGRRAATVRARSCARCCPPGGVRYGSPGFPPGSAWCG
jgi:hypothetical protein